MSDTPPTPVTELLEDFDTAVQQLALGARARILTLVPEAREKVTPGWKSMSYGTGSTMKDQFVALVLHKAHVNLQFLRGAELPDPAGILEGTGKAMRHVKLRSMKDLQRAEVDTLIEAAARLD